MPWAFPPLDFSSISFPFLMTAARFQQELHDKLVVLSVHTHSGASGEGSADIVPNNVTLGAGMLRESMGANVASASPLVIGTDGNTFHVTGSTGFSQINPTIQAGTVIRLIFDAGLTVVHNATTMELQTGANWAAPAGAMIELVSKGAGNWKEVTRWAAITGSGLTPSSITMSGAIYQSKGANVPSANSIALGSDGDYFDITGATQVNLINAASMRQDGSVVRLYLSGGLTLHHAQGTTGQLILAGSIDWAAPAGALITLISDGGLWRECGRVVP